MSKMQECKTAKRDMITKTVGVPESLLILLLVLSGCTGCDSSGSGEKGSSDSNSGSLAVSWKHPYNIAGGVRMAPKPVSDSLVLFGAEARLVALRSDDGSIKWRSPPVEPSSLELKVRDLSVSEHLVFGSHVGRLKAWSMENGQERWELRPEAGLYEIGYYGFNSGHVYVSSGGQLLSVDKRSGTVVRRYEPGAAGIVHDGGALYLGQAWVPEGAEGQAQGGLLKMNAATGDTLWFFKTKRGGFYDMRPVVEEGRVFAGTREGKAAFFAVDAQTGEEIWRNEDAPTFAPPASGEERVYLNTSAEVMALDKETGRTAWKKNMPGGSSFRGVVYLDGYVYHPRGGTLYVLNAETGEIVHEEPSPSSYYWTLAAGPERIYAQTSGHLMAYEPFQPE